MVKYVTILILFFSVGYSFAEGQPRRLINFLPDGTEIKIENNKVYAVCDGKFILVEDGLYELADGSKITVKNGELANERKVRKWATYPDEKNIDSGEASPSKP